jgi:hypothetical protein
MLALSSATYAPLAKARKPVSDAARAERQLAKVEMFLAAAWFDAVAAARNAISLTDLEALIIEASSAGILKAGDLPEIAWNETQSRDFAILGQPYTIIWVDVARFDAAWKLDGAQYSRDIPGLVEQVARVARQGVFLPPPAVVDLDGKGRWAFVSGMRRYIYTRAAGHKTLPLIVPKRDAKRLQVVAPDAPVADSGGGAVPAGALSRPYADLSDAISYVGLELGNRFFSAVMAAGMAVAERESVRLAAMLSSRARKADADTEDARAAGPTAAVDFETPNWGAVLELQMASLDLIREMSDEQREVILDAL